MSPQINNQLGCLDDQVTRRQQIGVKAGTAQEAEAAGAAAVGEDAQEAQFQKPKMSGRMKRPAACPKSLGKRSKGSADIKPATEDGVPAPMEVDSGSLHDQKVEMLAPMEVDSGDDGELPAPMEVKPGSSHDQHEVPAPTETEDGLAPSLAAKPKAKAKVKAKAGSKAKAKAGSKAKAKVKAGKAVEEAASETANDSDPDKVASDDDFDRATVLFDANPAHAAFYKGPEDVPLPPSSAEEASEPEAVPKPSGKGRGRGRGGRGKAGSGRGGKGRGNPAGVEDVAAKDAAPKPGKSGKGRGRGRGAKQAAVGDQERLTFAKRPVPTRQGMNLKRFFAIRDAFNNIVRPRVSDAPSKQEDLIGLGFATFL